MPLTEAELEPLLRLALVQGVGPHRLGILIHRIGPPAEVIGATPARLRTVPGIGPELAKRIRAAASPQARAVTAAALQTLRRLDAVAVTRDDPLFPASFKHLPDTPYLLFAAGELELLRLPSVAVVGTRSPTPYGRSAAEQLSSELALAGYGIVSGLARGIDSAAHRGALAVGGATVAVLGHGIEQVYPPENRRLFDAVRTRGLLITEYPPGETPKAGNFPRRNRLITALSLAVVVVEMGLQSGAQHTVTYALEQGKEVMAVPGSILSPVSAGTNQLIKDGARLVSSGHDVIEELRGVGSMPPPVNRPSNDAAVRPFPPGFPALPLLTADEERVLNALSTDPIHVDAIMNGCGDNSAAVLATLLQLELRGLVLALPGKRYSRS